MEQFFYGWYLKCQSKTQTMAVIPAVHKRGDRQSCSIQIITEEDAWTLEFPKDAAYRIGYTIVIDDNRFGAGGIRLAIHKAGLDIVGRLTFSSLTPLRYNIMGPFSLVPFLECRHSVFSMRHTVCGTMKINGKAYEFSNARGYWEGDQGRSFPKEYVWTQCFFRNGSLMLSVADVPIGGIRFCGVIGVIVWQGREYRIATYLGARAVGIGNKTVCVAQGDLRFEARVLDKEDRALRAPDQGVMVRTIYESAACHAAYRFQRKGETLFAFETDMASFEYEYPS